MRSIRGGSSLVVSEIGCNIFRLVGTIVLARLLTPEHFGLIGMVTALTALEFLIAFLQAYVFAILTCLYLAEAVNMEHH